MTLYRTLLSAAALSLGLAGSTCQAGDHGPGPGTVPGPSSPYSNNPKYPYFRTSIYGARQPLPVFQAAPWYLYWPYDGHFLTPAPVTGAFYGPPGPGNFMANPYFPAPANSPYGPIPGGPAPGGAYGYPPPPAGAPISARY